MNEADRIRLDALEKTIAAIGETFNEEMGMVQADLGEVKTDVATITGQLGIVLPLFTKLFYGALVMGLLQVVALFIFLISVVT